MTVDFHFILESRITVICHKTKITLEFFLFKVVTLMWRKFPSDKSKHLQFTFIIERFIKTKWTTTLKLKEQQRTFVSFQISEG